MAHFALAEIATYLGDHTTASNELEACLRVSPADPMLLMKLGDAFLADGEFEDALKTYQVPSLINALHTYYYCLF